MAKWKSTRVSLALSIIAVLLCFSTLGGATYALFTYEEPAANILVKSGAVDVDIQDAGGASIANLPLPFRNIDQNPSDPDKPLLWEPGVTYLSDPFFVKNIGDVTLNFRILLSGAGMENIEFLEAFEACIVDADGNPLDLSQYQHELKKGESAGEFRIKMSMLKTAGNKYKNREFNGVSVTVYAIQGGVDAFDETPVPNNP